MRWLSADDVGLSVIRPQLLTFVQADLDERLAAVRVRDWGFWPCVGRMHTFASMSIRGKRMLRDWVMTEVQSVTTDALAVRVIVIACGGLNHWWRLRPRSRVDVCCLPASLVSYAFLVSRIRVVFT